jgi:hypothetical protein
VRKREYFDFLDFSKRLMNMLMCVGERERGGEIFLFSRFFKMIDEDED